MDNHNACEQAWLNGYKQGREAVEKKGPIDVAIVVRCKDCKYYQKMMSELWHCSRLSEVMEDDFYVLAEDEFCSFGERKTNEKK